MRWSLLVPLSAAAVAVMVVVAGVLPVAATRLLADLTGFVGAAVAAVAFAVTAARRRSPGRWPMALGLAGWALGQFIWTWHRSIDGRASTFPDVENALYLVLPFCVGSSLIIAARWHGRDRSPDAPTRVLVLDALLLCVGIVGLTWETSFGAAAERTAKDALELALASIYTITDLALIMFALVLALGLRRMWRRPLVPLIAGLASIGFSDAVYGYTISADLAAPTWADAGYMFGPWLLVACALVPDRPFRRREAVSLLLMPYVPLAAALGLTLWHSATSASGPSPAEIYVLVALLFLVVLRQLISQRRLAAAHRSLTRHARTDPLTEVANRSGLEAFHRDVRDQDQDVQLGLLLCDLDQFKPINDTHGHGTGDVVLKVVAARLRACVRGGDLVARLGGDEFVVVLDPVPADPHSFIERITDAIAAPMLVDGSEHQVTISIGYSVVRPGDDFAESIKEADRQMYSAKIRSNSRSERFA